MNPKVEQYWRSFCAAEGLENITYKEAFQFGTKADELAALVVNGKKSATCSSFPIYELENEPLPKVDEYNIIVNSREEPVAIIKGTSVEIMPFHEIPEDFALAEGEGTYEEWHEAHVQFFTEYLKQYDLIFDETMLTVCERFTKVYPK